MANPAPSPSRPTRQVAVVIDLEFALPWHQDTYNGIMCYGKERGWRCSLDKYAAGIHGETTGAYYDGVVGRIPVEVAKRVSKAGIPMVGLTPYVESNHPDQFTDLPGVYVDRQASIEMAVGHLAHCGYSRIGAIPSAGIDCPPFLEMAETASAPQNMEWVQPFIFPEDFEDGVEAYGRTLGALHAWLERVEKPIGLIANRTAHARIIAHACTGLGIAIPQSIGIVTPMGDRLMLLSSSPTITGIEFDFFQQGYQAAAMLDRLMNGEVLDEREIRLPPTEIIMRDSTDIFLCSDKMVSGAVRYIAENVSGELSVDQVADAMEVSRWTLHRRFLDVLDRTPGQEINRLRTLYLKRVLRTSNKPISEIAGLCGFTNPSHFSRYFKQHSGHTPSAYRELMER